MSLGLYLPWLILGWTKDELGQIVFISTGLIFFIGLFV